MEKTKTPTANRRTLIIRIVLIAMILGTLLMYWFYVYEPPVNDDYRWQKITGAVEMPTSITALDDNRMLVSQLEGQILLMEDGKIADDPFLDLVPKVTPPREEQGFFRVLADPNFDDNGYIYVHYTSRQRTQEGVKILAGDNVVERYTVSEDNPNTADPNSATLVFTTEQFGPIHNGGDMQFDEDGMLLIALGESADKVLAQDLTSVLGSLLRIDVTTLPYTIPADNPFVDDDDARDEIYSYGLRNPWRFSLDAKTGDIYIADVGHSSWEEVNIIPAASNGGQNFGWPAYEGVRPFIGDDEYKDVMTVEGATKPIHQYTHYQKQGQLLVYYCGITGGYVYRGEALPDLHGQYFFTDRCQGDIWTLDTTQGNYPVSLFMDTSFMINSFGEDANHELYALTIDGIWKLVAH